MREEVLCSPAIDLIIVSVEALKDFVPADKIVSAISIGDYKSYYGDLTAREIEEAEKS